MYPWISRTLDFWLQFCEKKCGLYMDVYGNNNVIRYIVLHSWMLQNCMSTCKYFRLVVGLLKILIRINTTGSSKVSLIAILCSSFITRYFQCSIVILNSYSSRTRRIWADIYNQRGHRPSWLLSAHIRQVRVKPPQIVTFSLPTTPRKIFFWPPKFQHKKFAITFSLFGQT